MKKDTQKSALLISIIFLFQALLIPSAAFPGMMLYCDRVEKPKKDYQLERFWGGGNKTKKGWPFIYAERENDEAGFTVVMAQNDPYQQGVWPRPPLKSMQVGVFLFDTDSNEYLMTILKIDASNATCYCLKEVGTDYVVLLDTLGGEWKYFFDLKNKKTLGKVESHKSTIRSIDLHDGLLYIFATYNDKEVMITVDPAKKDNKEKYRLTTEIDQNVLKAIEQNKKPRYDLSGYKLQPPTREIYNKFLGGGYDDEYVGAPAIRAQFKTKDKVWFGTTFFNGEDGYRSMGGFGYVDLKTKKMEFSYYRDLAHNSASSIYVENDNVWIGLYVPGEHGSYSRGLGVYNLSDGSFKEYSLPGKYIVHKMIKLGDELYVFIGGKAAVFSNEKFSPILTIGPDINGDPTLNLIEDINDLDDFKWGM